MSFTATFSGGPAVLVMEGSFKLQNRVDERSRCSFTVADPTGIATYPKGSRVVVTDSVLGVLYTGFVNSAKPQNLIAQPYIYWDIDTVDMHYLADKVTSADSYVNQSAGVVVADQYLKYLQPEGVLAPVAMDTENSQAEWAEGTLASTVATGNVGDGDLELNSSTSAQDAYVTQTNWNTGTKVSVTANLGTGGVGDVALTSSSRNWDNGVKSGQSLWGNGNPSDQVVSGQYQLHCDANSQTQARLDFAGAWANFTVTCDCYLHASTFKSGFTYRTTGWVNGDSSYAYAIEMTNAGIELHVGTNGGSGGDTTLASVSFSPQLATGQMYTIKAVVSGSSHNIYVNGTLYISVTDSTYTAAGYFGLRNRNTYSSGTWRYFDNFGVVSATSGTWTSPSASINAVSTIASTIIMWDTSLSTGGTVLVQTSIDGGSTYQTAASGGPIPKLTKGSSGTGKNLLIKVTFSTTNLTLIPDIRSLSWSVIGGYVASGTRNTVPLANDTMARANQSGWSPSFDGQTITKVGTGTDAISGNEGTITNTTGDCHEKYDSGVGTDLDGTVRFQLSASTMQAGMELRYVDANNLYRLAVSTTTVSIVKIVSGASTTLASIAMTISVATHYYMRFRIVGVPGSGPASLYGKVWLDQSLEPGVVNGYPSATAPAWSLVGSD